MPQAHQSETEAQTGARVLASSGKLSLLTMASRVLGLIREMSRGAALGTGSLAEAFTAAFNVPNLMRRLFAENSMTAAFIPTLQGYLGQGDKKATKDFLSSMLTVLCLSVGLFCLAGILSADLIVMIFKSDPLETAALTRIMFPFLAMVSLAAFFQGILNSLGSFTPSAIAPLLFNLCFIFLPLAISPLCPNPARAMAWAVSLGGLLQAGCQVPSLIRRGYFFGFANPIKAFTHPGVRKVMLLIAPTILGMAAYELNSLVSVSLATAVKAATALSFSLRLQELILGVFVVSIGTVILPLLSSQAKAGDFDAFSQRLGSSFNAVSLITLPIMAFCLVEGHDLVALLFKVKSFGDASVDLTSDSFFFHTLGLFFIGQTRILSPAFYALGDTKSPSFSGVASFAVNIVLAWILSRLLGGRGIALALSLASLVNFTLLALLLSRRRELRSRVFGKSLAYAARIAAFSLIAGLPVYLLRPGVRRLCLGISAHRLVANGLPLLVLGLLFAGIGVFFLFISHDPLLARIGQILRKDKSPRG